MSNVIYSIMRFGVYNRGVFYSSHDLNDVFRRCEQLRAQDIDSYHDWCIFKYDNDRFEDYIEETKNYDSPINNVEPESHCQCEAHSSKYCELIYKASKNEVKLNLTNNVTLNNGD